MREKKTYGSMDELVKKLAVRSNSSSSSKLESEPEP
jgi:hypothetical protein